MWHGVVTWQGENNRLGSQMDTCSLGSRDISSILTVWLWTWTSLNHRLFFFSNGYKDTNLTELWVINEVMSIWCLVYYLAHCGPPLNGNFMVLVYFMGVWAEWALRFLLDLIQLCLCPGKIIACVRKVFRDGWIGRDIVVPGVLVVWLGTISRKGFRPN